MLPVEKLFSVIKDLPAHEREKKLSELIPDNPQKQSELLSLALIADDAQGFLSDADFSRVDSELDLAPPDTIQSYKIGELLGMGGSGRVYAAYKTSDFEHKVAVKFLNTPVAQGKLRFYLERQLLAKLNHPYICKLHDGGFCPQTGLPFLIMEYIQGQSITQYCKEKQLSVQQILNLFIKVCEAINYLHEHNVIHRDLKPSNILIDHLGLPKIIDFGIAKWNWPSSSGQLTLTGQMICTPEYASPEQVNQQEISNASDIYSLGCILYEILSGYRPFDFSAKNLTEILNTLQNKQVVAPSKRCVSQKARAIRPLDKMILRALNRKANLRYPDVLQFKTAIAQHLPSHPHRDISFIVKDKTRKFSYKMFGLIVFLGLLMGMVLAPVYFKSPLHSYTESPKNRQVILKDQSREIESARPSPAAKPKSGNKLTQVTSTARRQPPLRQKNPPPTRRVDKNITVNKTQKDYYFLSLQSGNSGQFAAALKAARNCQDADISNRKKRVTQWKCALLEAHWLNANRQAAKALKRLERLRHTFAESGQRPRRGLRVRMLEESSEAMAQLGRSQQALEMQQQAMGLAQRIRNRKLRSYIQQGLARRLNSNGDYTQAYQLLQQSLTYWQQEVEIDSASLKNQQSLAAVYAQLTLLHKPDDPQACPWYNKTTSSLKGVPNKFGLSAHRFPLPGLTHFHRLYQNCRTAS